MARRTPLTFVLLVAATASIHADDYGSFYTYSYTKVAHAQKYPYPAPSTSPVSSIPTGTFERSTKSPYKPSPIFYAFGTAVEKPWPEVSQVRASTPAPSPLPQSPQNQTRVLGAVQTPAIKSETPLAVMEAPLGADRAFQGIPAEGAGLGGGQAFQGINAPAPELTGGSRAFDNVNIPADSGLGSRAFESLGKAPSSEDLGSGRAFDPVSQDSSGLSGSRAFENVGPSVAPAQLQGGQAF